MLAINPIFSKFNNIYNFKSQQIKQQPKHNNLAPLAHDCVSFTSSKKLNRSLLDAFDNIEVCKEIQADASLAETNLKKTLRTSLQDLFVSEENQDGPIVSLSTRIKSAESIREKIASELSHALTTDIDKVFSPNKKNDIKKICKDIIGARITLGRHEKEGASKIIDALIENIKKGELLVDSVANHQPKDIDKDLEYFKREDLLRLVDAVNESRAKHGKPPIKLREEPKKTGYMALNLDVNLSNPEYKAKNTGYLGEIQIVGQDVSRLKEVEDFCYKIRFDKDIKGGNISYSPFVNYFSKNLKNEKYPNLADDFIEYTKRAYMYQRKKEPQGFDKKGRKDTLLPTIEQCGMADKIPPQLDFNILAKIKFHCDKLYEITTPETV